MFEHAGRSRQEFRLDHFGTDAGRLTVFALSLLHDLLHDSLQTHSNPLNASQLPNGNTLKIRVQQGFCLD
jgi:hypothetical protein